MRLFRVYRSGDSGAEVAYLQRSLPWWCWGSPSSSEADGQFGGKTAAAVKVFQSSEDLSQDGVAGEDTLRRLGVWSDVVAGIDVSSYQTVDWSAVSRDEFTCVWAKASEGATYRDPRFVSHVRGARGAGMAVGAYHFAKLNHEPWDEAENFLGQLELAGSMDLPCVLDYEEDANTDTTHWLLCFLRQMREETGSTPVLYTGAWRLRALSGPVGRLSEFRYWIPGWGAQPGFYGPFSNWDAWQWTNKGVVSGVAGNVDRNWLEVGLLA